MARTQGFRDWVPGGSAIQLAPGTVLDGEGDTWDGPTLILTDGCVLKDWKFPGGAQAVRTAIGTAPVGVTISGCEFNGYTTQAVYVQKPVDSSTPNQIRVERCSFVNCTGTAVLVDRASDCLVAFNRFRGCTYNLVVRGGSRNRVIGNTIDGGTTGIAFVYEKVASGSTPARQNVIVGNTVHSSEAAITFDVKGNDAANFPLPADLFWGNVIADNTVDATDATDPGITLWGGCVGTVVKGNTVTGGPQARIRVSSLMGLPDPGGDNDALCTDNLVIGNIVDGDIAFDLWNYGEDPDLDSTNHAANNVCIGGSVTTDHHTLT